MAHPALSASGGAAEALDLASAWSLRLEVAAPLALVTAAYTLGWWRLSRRGAPVSRWRAAAGAGSLATIAIALLSPLDALADRLFTGHMIQHLLLIAVAAPLILLADPFPALVWALPGSARAAVGRALRRGGWGRRVGVALTALPLAWTLHVLVVWFWHVPVAYDAAVADRLLHDLEHVAFFASAVLFWWPVIHPAPRLRAAASYAARMTVLVLGALQGALLGLLLATSSEVWYASYARAAPPWSLAPLDDQAIGGLVMWGVGGAIDMLAVLLLGARMLSAEDRSAARGPRSVGNGWAGRGR
jgi:cytochrome c oxidase assembly factor CtaG